MAKTAAALLGSAMFGSVAADAAGQAFAVGQARTSSETVRTSVRGAQQVQVSATEGPAGCSLSTGAALAAAGLLAAAGVRRMSRRSTAAKPAAVVGLSSSLPAQQEYFRDRLVACRAQLSEAEAPSPEETDGHMKELEAYAKQALAGAAAALVFNSSMEAAVAYPIFAQQNYANPREYTGKIVCANCHLAGKPIDVRNPQAVLPDTIFKTQIEVPAKYYKRKQPLADGSKGPLNVGAVAIMPEGWKLAPKDRLPKALKKEMKGLAWAPYSKEFPNIVVAGPVPGETYEKMVLPILAPDPNTANNPEIQFGKAVMYYGGNRGRGQVYPEGNQSNNNQFFAAATGKITAIDGMKITIRTPDGEDKIQELLPGADIQYQVGEEVTKDDPITTNPNVGGFGQAESEVILQDMNRVYGYCALAFSIFVGQLTFVLKKKQFEKVQLAEGF
eukprot:TRINITY_DN851_c0_g1_i13.p1 TRINITY_DN851_c0_g1~~TRINITY_DN851_c0_g1_i13.p1  ORF type:complete len:444 (-),score=130.43 TRINITY_DN851_c0_g1_i13:269-1600(-)